MLGQFLRTRFSIS
ncbi:hypothetical protein CP8484711_2341A, partial [Chlamydia psittaci 84-8471/1]